MMKYWILLSIICPNDDQNEYAVAKYIPILCVYPIARWALERNIIDVKWFIKPRLGDSHLTEAGSVGESTQKIEW